MIMHQPFLLYLRDRVPHLVLDISQGVIDAEADDEKLAVYPDSYRAQDYDEQAHRDHSGPANVRAEASDYCNESRGNTQNDSNTEQD